MKAHMRPIKEITVGWNRVKYEVEIVHEGLGLENLVKATEKRLLLERAEAKMKQLNKKWEKLLREKSQQEKLNLAEERTRKAQEEQRRIDSILEKCSFVAEKPTLSMLLKNVQFLKPKPVKPAYPLEPDYIDWPVEPQRSQFKTNTGCGCLAFLFNTKKDDEIRYKTAYNKWNWNLANIKKENSVKRDYYQQKCRKIDTKYVSAYKKWNEDKKIYENEIEEYNSAIEELSNGYRNKQPGAIGDLFKYILDNYSIPSWIPRKHETLFNANNGILAIEGLLPDFDDVPVLENVRFVKTRNEFVEKHLAVSKQNSLYDRVVYQIVLRSIYEVLKWDINEYISSVVYNGLVKSIDKATGNTINPCILSIQVSREEFTATNLELVDPKECFRKLKGIASSKLFTLIPVAPVLRIDKDDRRFVEGKQVVEGVMEGDNLAAMDWEDFEHLIREIFEEEFAESGGEVRVTRASRDGGVDAVIFDPDPIKGGKIVVQAKRYTNTVGVSAVRDLYGTLVNEGANKGILVSTSDYGPDAYKFAKGKPIVLLNGSELLYLLEKHGHKARIDIKEAKMLLAEQEKREN
ncbi:MAG: restriction endonuclease [Actinomycetia bacterium]|nr:restriction endonuclease [Actinomycetes bacterium]